MKRQATDWEKIFAIHISEKGLVSKIFKEYLKLNNNKNNPIFKMAKNLNIYLTKEDMQQLTNTYFVIDFLKSPLNKTLILGGKGWVQDYFFQYKYVVHIAVFSLLYFVYFSGQYHIICIMYIAHFIFKYVLNIAWNITYF